MNANENLEKQRKNAIAIVKLGGVFMSIGIIPLFCVHAIFILAYQGKMISFPDIIVGIIAASPLIATPLFVSGFILLLIGLLSFVLFLIGLLKKQESL